MENLVRLAIGPHEQCLLGQSVAIGSQPYVGGQQYSENTGIVVGQISMVGGAPGGRFGFAISATNGRGPAISAPGERRIYLVDKSSVRAIEGIAATSLCWFEDMLAVGIPAEDAVHIYDDGSLVDIYKRPGQFGYAIASAVLDGEHCLIVGAPDDGKAYMIRNREASVIASGYAHDRLGSAVAGGVESYAIGAPSGRSSDYYDLGYVHWFHHGGHKELWGANHNSQFGASLAIANDQLAVGEPYFTGDRKGSGRVTLVDFHDRRRIFISGTESWSLLGAAMDSDGERLIIGSPGYSNGRGTAYTWQTPALLGDVNEDGAIDNLDAVLVYSHAVGLPVQLNAQAADANNDGEINNLDALIISGWAIGV